MNCSRIALLVLVLAGLMTGTAHAQTGVRQATAEEYARVPVWKPSAWGVATNYRVDLRPFLPEVGDQAPQGSCVGWAVAYGAKTYHEVRDQEWTPNAAERKFSPAFVYNQINGGQDRGSSVEEALQLLQEDGCATLATMPYRPNDFLSEPSSLARAEAGRFKISSYSALHNAWTLKRALDEGNIVVVVIKTTPLFVSGNWEMYTPGLKARGDAEAQLGQGGPNKHGFHALCAVGYDERIGGLLLMNSWGPEWGSFVRDDEPGDQNAQKLPGFCWVSDDLVAEIGPGEPNFMWEAYVVKDERLPVQRDEVRPEALTLGAEVWPVGYQKDENRWRFKVFLLGAASATDQIESVRWKAEGADGPDSTTTRERDDAFAFIGDRAGPGVVELTATVQFASGRSHTLTKRLDFGEPRNETRALTLAQADRYWGQQAMGDGTRRPYWEWTVRLDGDLVTLGDVAEVTYHLHPTFPNPDWTERTGPETGFAMTTRGWGGFTIRATVTFKDGTTSSLQTRLQFEDPVDDDLRLTNTSMYMGRDDEGTPRWDWTARVEGPLRHLRDIDHVAYHLHDTFPEPTRSVRRDAGPGFPIATNGWGTFTLGATVRFNDGSTRDLVHALQFQRAEGIDGDVVIPVKK